MQSTLKLGNHLLHDPTRINFTHDSGWSHKDTPYIFIATGENNEARHSLWHSLGHFFRKRATAHPFDQRQVLNKLTMLTMHHCVGPI